MKLEERQITATIHGSAHLAAIPPGPLVDPIGCYVDTKAQARSKLVVYRKA